MSSITSPAPIICIRYIIPLLCIIYFVLMDYFSKVSNFSNYNITILMSHILIKKLIHKI